jgi:hypothetical protein
MNFKQIILFAIFDLAVALILMGLWNFLVAPNEYYNISFIQCIGILLIVDLLQVIQIIRQTIHKY